MRIKCESHETHEGFLDTWEQRRYTGGQPLEVRAVVALAEERQLRVEERAFSVEEALAAKEAFITSATVFVQAVVSIDGKKVADGKPGPMTNRLREIYVEFAKATAV